MIEIIPPIDKELIEAELTKDKFLRNTNNGGNIIYTITHHDSPNTMKEIGRLREYTFRNAGGGTGKEADIDKYDIAEKPYIQLIVWDPDLREILGGYRYILGANAQKDADGNYQLATAGLLNFSDEFTSEYIPNMIELGRSFVQPLYQSTSASRKGIFALDNLWDGLGALVVNHPEIKYFFGKVTMYRHFNVEARNMILYFLDKYFNDKDKLATPLTSLETNTDINKMKEIFIGTNYKEDHKILSQNVRALGENIPPLINAYMNLSPTMKAFGTAINENFGNVEETGILLKIEDIYEEKKNRHIVFDKE